MNNNYKFSELYAKYYENDFKSSHDHNFYFSRLGEDSYPTAKIIHVDNERKIVNLCKHLIDLGYILPILDLALSSYVVGPDSNEELMYRGYLDLNSYEDRKCYSIVLNCLRKNPHLQIGNKTIADICEAYIQWQLEEIRNNGKSNLINKHHITDVNTYFNYGMHKFVCNHLLDIDNEYFDFHTRKPTWVNLPESARATTNSRITLDYEISKEIDYTLLEEIIEEKIIKRFNLGNQTDEVSFSIVSWIISSVFPFLCEEGQAYISKKYIIPIVNKTHFENEYIIKNQAVLYWVYMQKTSSVFFDNAQIHGICEQTSFSLYTNEMLVLAKESNVAFSEILPTSCKGFGEELSKFFDCKSILDDASIDRRVADNRFEHKRRMIWDIGFYCEDFNVFHILCLLADDNTNEAIMKMTNNIELWSYNSPIRGVNEKMALLKAFYLEGIDFSVKSILYNIICHQMTQDKESNPYWSDDIENVWSDIKDEMNSYTLEMAKPLIEKIKEVTDQFKEGDESNFSRMENITNILEQKIATFDINSAEHYNNILDGSIQKLYEEIKGADSSRDIYCVLGSKAANTVKSYLRQSELIMDLQKELKNKQWQDEIDYSAPVILMTKALEYIGNILFKKLTKNTTPPNNIFHMYKDNNGWSEHITLGNIAYLFKNQEFRSGTNDIHKLISKVRIEALKGKTVIVDNNGNKEEFKNDINKNLNVMFKALKYIADNFRNQAAHSDLTPEQKYKKCRELVITTQHLLFVLLYIIEDGTILGD